MNNPGTRPAYSSEPLKNPVISSEKANGFFTNDLIRSAIGRSFKTDYNSVIES